MRTIERPGARAGVAPSCVLHLREIAHVRPRPEFFEHAIVATAAVEPRDPAVGIGQIAEHDRLGRTDLLARRLDLAVRDRAPLLLRRQLGPLDALDAEAALL